MRNHKLNGLFIAIGAMVISFTLNRISQKYIEENRVVHVKGLVEEVITSDYATWNISFNSQGKDFEEAKAKIQNKKIEIMNFIAQRGFIKDEIGPTIIHSNFSYRYEGVGEKQVSIPVFNISYSILLETKNPQKMVDAYSKMEELLNKGIILDSGSPSYFYTNFQSLKEKMLSQAAKRALDSAEKFVNSLKNSKVGHLKNANQGAFQITDPITDEADYGNKCFRKKIRVVSSLEFAIKNKGVF